MINFFGSAFLTKLAVRRTWALPASVLMTLPAGYLLSVSPTTKAMAAAALADPLSVFAARSPGARAPGALTQTKLAYADARSLGDVGNTVPKERVLSGERSRGAPATASHPPVDALAPDGDIFVAMPAQAESAPGSPLPFDDTNIGSGVTVAPGGGTIVDIPGGGGGGGGGNPGRGGTVIVPGDGSPPVASVPEPSTWLTLFVGFFSMGFALRSQHRRDRRSSVTTAAT